MNSYSNIVAPALVRYPGVDNLRMTGGGARVFEANGQETIMSIAQMNVSGSGEHRSTKPGVGSSNLPGRTLLRKYAENASDYRELTSVGGAVIGRARRSYAARTTDSIGALS